MTGRMIQWRSGAGWPSGGHSLTRWLRVSDAGWGTTIQRTTTEVTGNLDRRPIPAELCEHQSIQKGRSSWFRDRSTLEDGSLVRFPPPPNHFRTGLAWSTRFRPLVTSCEVDGTATKGKMRLTSTSAETSSPTSKGCNDGKANPWQHRTRRIRCRS